MARPPLNQIFGATQRQPLEEIFNVQKPQEPGYLERVGSQFQKAGQRAISGINEGAQDIQQGDKLGGVRAGLRTVGSVAGAAFAPVMEIPVVKKGIEAVMEKATEVPVIQNLANKGIELSQKYPKAAKDIEDIVNIGTLGLGQAASKPIQNIVTDSAQSVARGVKTTAEFVGGKAKGVIPKSEEIMNRVARLKPTDANTFRKLSGGESHGEYLTKTGNFGTPDQIITKESEKFVQSINDVDTELAKLPGLYKNGAVDDALDGLVERGLNVSSGNTKAPWLQDAMQLQSKNDLDGLTMAEINAVKRLYEKNVKLGYNKLINGDKVEQATLVDTALRKFQFEQADRLGFTNLGELNKQTQLSKFIINKLGDQVVGQNGLNGVSLTDWVMLSGGDPTAVAGFLTKKFFSSKSIQSRIAKMLSKTEPEGQIKPNSTPIEFNPLQLEGPAIPLGPKTPRSSSVEVLPASKNPVTVNPKTGKFQTTYSSTPSKTQSPQSPKIQSKKALTESSSIPAKKSSLLSIANENLKNNGQKGSAEIFKNSGDLTTKILKDLEGKTTVSKQYIQDLAGVDSKTGLVKEMLPTGLKKPEAEVFAQILKDEGDNVNIADFAKKVKAELLPLKRKSVGSPHEGMANLSDELRGNVKSYGENIYESPIKTSAGSKHYGNTSDSYFGHTRIEDMADNKTRRVIEVQSDLYQKGNLEIESNKLVNRMTEAEKKTYDKLDAFRNNGEGTLVQRDEAWAKMSKLRDEAEKRPGTPNKKLAQYNDPTAHFRMVREEIKKAAQDGKTKLQFPTGETAMKIEGLGERNTWELAKTNERGSTIPQGRLTEEKLKAGQQIYGNGSEWIITDVLGDGKFKAVPKDNMDFLSEELAELGVMGPDDLGPAIARGDRRVVDLLNDGQTAEQFDISGKVDTNNPIYKFYEKDVQKYLNKFGGKKVVDDKGVSWIEIPITKEQGIAPVEAFGKAQMGAVMKIGLGTAAVAGGLQIKRKLEK